MKKQNQLIFARSIFIFFIVIIFGFIIVSEKGGELFLPKAKQKINTYLEENYKEEKEDWIIEEPTYEKRIFKEKIRSKDNHNLFFYITYKDKKITDTYQKDYIEGKTLLDEIKKELEKEILEKTNIKSNVIILSKLNEYTTSVRDRIIKEENLLQLKFYKLETELLIKDWKEETITKEIVDLLNTYQKENITPKYYSLIITNQEEITQSIEISNLTENFLTNNSKKEIISAIIEEKNTSILEENKIEVKYLN